MNCIEALVFKLSIVCTLHLSCIVGLMIRLILPIGDSVFIQLCSTTFFNFLALISSLFGFTESTAVFFNLRQSRRAELWVVSLGSSVVGVLLFFTNHWLVK